MKLTIRGIGSSARVRGQRRSITLTGGAARRFMAGALVSSEGSKAADNLAPGPLRDAVVQAVAQIPAGNAGEHVWTPFSISGIDYCTRCFRVFRFHGADGSASYADGPNSPARAEPYPCTPPALGVPLDGVSGPR